MGGPGDPADVALAAFAERNIPVKREELELIFDREPSSAKWVLEHLGNDTLLSKEELSLHSKLGGSGVIGNFLRCSDINASRPFLEQDIRTAIESLETSTSAIEKQTNILNLQWDNLGKQVRLQNDRKQARSRDSAQLRSKHELGRQNIAAASDDLVDGIEVCLRDETEKVTTEGRSVLSLTAAKLRDDDKALGALERLASSLDSAGDSAAAVRRATELSATFEKYVTEEIHYRLDRLFLESMHDGHLDSDASSGIGDEEDLITAFEGELESLYPEIEVLAEMSTRKQFSEPILRELQNHHDKLRVTSIGKLEYIADKIIDMTSSTENLTERLRDRKSFRVTLEALADLYQAERGDRSSAKPARRETLQRYSLQARMLQATPRKSVVPFPESSAFERILRRITWAPLSILP